MRWFLGTTLAAYVIALQAWSMYTIEQSTWREGLNDWLYVALGLVWLGVFVLTTRATYKGVMLADWEHWDGREEQQ